MTSENRFIVGIEDIKAISLECNKCKVRLTYALDALGKVPPTCPNPLCNVEWFWDAPSSSSERKFPALLKLISAIAEIRHRQKEIEIENPNQSVGFRVLLEFDEPQ